MSDHDKYLYDKSTYVKLFCRRLLRKIIPFAGYKKRIQILKDMLKINSNAVMEREKKLDEIYDKLNMFGKLMGYNPDKGYIVSDPKYLEIENIIYEIRNIIERPSC